MKIAVDTSVLVIVKQNSRNVDMFVSLCDLIVWDMLHTSKFPRLLTRSHGRSIKSLISCDLKSFFAQDGNIDENLLTVVDCFPQVTIAIPSLCCTSVTLYTSKDGTNKMMFIKPKGPLEGGLLTL